MSKTATTPTCASIQVSCPRCERESFAVVGGDDRIRFASKATGDPGDEADTWRCLHCGAQSDGVTHRPRHDAVVSQCWVCGADEFYIQKDFNRQLGLFIVLLSAGFIFLVMLLTQDHRLGVVLLLAVAAVDWVIYRCLRNVTVCYLCQSIYRGFPQNNAHRGFYLGLEEKYKKPRRSWLEKFS